MYLKCHWCDRNASKAVRIKIGTLVGICLDHLQTIPTETNSCGDLFTTEASAV